MNQVTDIKQQFTPLVQAQGIPWEKVKGAIIVYELEDCIHISISEMAWKDRIWMSGELQNFNAAEGAANYLNQE